VTLLGHRALGDRLRTYFVQNGLMREGEPERVVELFRTLGVKVELVDAQDEFFAALKGVTDPEEKREAITQTFYQKVFRRLVKASGAKHLLQGTILTDIDETAAASSGSTTSSSKSASTPRKPLATGSSSRWCGSAKMVCARSPRRSGFRPRWPIAHPSPAPRWQRG